MLLLAVLCLAAVPATGGASNTTYDPDWSKGLNGYGRTWMYFPDGAGEPQVALLASEERSTPSIPSEVGAEEVTFYLYTRNQQREEVIDADDPSSLWQSSFNPKRPTRFVAHGWKSSAKAEIIQSLRKAYLEVEDCNVIGVDWSDLAGSSFYPWAKSYTNPVGRRVSTLIKMMVGEDKWGKKEDTAHKKRKKKRKKAVTKLQAGKDKGARELASLDDIHLVGHSLGAHLMGYAGKHLRPHKVARITGLDPAMPLFEILPSSDGHLDQSDAQFVDVIHTCGGALGYLDSIGHVDFYPNGGTPIQPGCCCAAEFGEACSHGRSYQYFAESITSKEFIGVACDSWESFLNGSCSNGSRAVMGEHVPPSTRGVYYLKTRDEMPYANGVEGTRMR